MHWEERYEEEGEGRSGCIGKKGMRRRGRGGVDALGRKV